MSYRSISVSKWVEIVFDVLYLSFVFVAGIMMLTHASSSNPALQRFGVLALVLGGGDSFHLIPRMLQHLSGEPVKSTQWLGRGKMITSITMTLFYVILYDVWRIVYGVEGGDWLSTLILVLAAIRIALCFCPQNRWLDADSPVRWGIYRNIPFLLIGIILTVLFAVTASFGDGFRYMPIAIALSFALYIPVVLFAHRYPAVGALMLPKSVSYVWIVWMGFSLL